MKELLEGWKIETEQGAIGSAVLWIIIALVAVGLVVWAMADDTGLSPETPEAGIQQEEVFGNPEDDGFGY